MFNFNTPLEKGIFLSGVTSSPDMQFVDPNDVTNIITGVFIEEVPSETFGIDTISIINPGFNYQLPPTVTILGDGSGASATAVITNGSISAINVTSSGNNYTSAIAVISPQSTDTSGRSGAAVVNLQGRYGTLRTYYYSNNVNGQIKTIFNPNIGTIDYTNGIINLNSFNPYQIDNPLGELTISAKPTTSVISSTFDGIITSDPFDPNAIVVKLTAKTN